MTRRRAVRIPTPERLANAALYYLGRYAASEASLRRVLENKIRRAVIAHEVFASDVDAQRNLRDAIEKIIETYRRTGVLNDAAYAEMKVHSLRRSGRSARAISLKLSQKGISDKHIQDALIPDDGRELREADVDAAHALAKRRCLGPYRKKALPDTDRSALAKVQAREAATLARAGFSFDIIKEVLGAEIDEGEV